MRRVHRDTSSFLRSPEKTQYQNPTSHRPLHSSSLPREATRKMSFDADLRRIDSIIEALSGNKRGKERNARAEAPEDADRDRFGKTEGRRDRMSRGRAADPSVSPIALNNSSSHSLCSPETGASALKVGGRGAAENLEVGLSVCSCSCFYIFQNKKGEEKKNRKKEKKGKKKELSNSLSCSLPPFFAFSLRFSFSASSLFDLSVHLPFSFFFFCFSVFSFSILSF